ncbi:hypothetical protein Tco_0422874, partial [Tanacetum coccineum]
KFNFSKYIFESMVKNLDKPGKFLMYPRPKRKDTEVLQPSGHTDNVADEVVNEDMDDSLERPVTIATSLDAEQDSVQLHKNIENDSKRDVLNDPLLARGNTLRSGEDSLKLNELMELCTNLQTRVLDLEKTKTTQAEEIGRINAIDADEDITLVNDQDDADMFDVNTLTGDEVLAEQEVATKDVNLTVDEVTLAQALATLKSVKSKVKGDVIEEPSVPVSAASTKVSAATTTTTATIPTPRKGIVITELGTSTTTTTISSQPSHEKVQDKGKEKMIEPEKPLKKKDQISFDEQEAIRLQAEFDEEERLAREKDEANVALTEEWDDIQAKVDADYQLAQRLQAEEQEQFTTEQKATLFKELLEQRRKHFAAKRAEEKRNKPPTKAQQRRPGITYHLVEGSSKRAGDELEQEVTKKQKVDDVQETAEVDDDQEAAKIKELMKIIPDEEEVAIDAIPLATKPPTIVDWKIHKEGKKNYYQIIRADGIKAKYGSTRPDGGLRFDSMGRFKTIFETTWLKTESGGNQLDYCVLDWNYMILCNGILASSTFSQNILESMKSFGASFLVINEAFNEETCDFGVKISKFIGRDCWD